jgi:hypothetical protein
MLRISNNGVLTTGSLFHIEFRIIELDSLILFTIFSNKVLFSTLLLKILRNYLARRAGGGKGEPEVPPRQAIHITMAYLI